MGGFNEHMDFLTTQWGRAKEAEDWNILDEAKLVLQKTLNAEDPSNFPRNNTDGTAVDLLVEKLLAAPATGHTVYHYCKRCDEVKLSTSNHGPVFYLQHDKKVTVASELKRTMMASKRKCTTCKGLLVKNRVLGEEPFPLMFVGLPDQWEKLKISLNMTLTIEKHKHPYKLRGICYHGNNHFTSRVVDASGKVWYHDGITSKRNLELDGKFSSIDCLSATRNKRAIGLIYSSII